jgi:prepilin-type N-terminal cleavage/methylation domain-containing protein
MHRHTCTARSASGPYLQPALNSVAGYGTGSPTPFIRRTVAANGFGDPFYRGRLIQLIASFSDFPFDLPRSEKYISLYYSADSHGGTALTTTRNKAWRAGFTLVELLTVITIISILAAMTIGISGYVRRAQMEAKTRAKLQSIRDALEVYKLEAGKYPDVGGAQDKGIAATEILTFAYTAPMDRRSKVLLREQIEKNKIDFRDAWQIPNSTNNEPFIYVRTSDDSARVFSIGSDHVRDTADDIIE